MSMSGTSSVGQLILQSQRGAAKAAAEGGAALNALSAGGARLFAQAGGAGFGDGNLRGLYGQLAQKFLSARGSRGVNDEQVSQASKALEQAAAAAKKAAEKSAAADGDTVTLSAVATRTLAPTLRGGSGTGGGGAAGGGGSTSQSTSNGPTGGTANGEGSSVVATAPAAVVPAAPTANTTPAAPTAPAATTPTNTTPAAAVVPSQSAPAAVVPAAPTANVQAAALVTTADVQDQSALARTRAVLAEVIASGGQVNRVSNGRYEFVLGNTRGELRAKETNPRLDLTFTNASTGQTSTARATLSSSGYTIVNSSNTTARGLATNFLNRVNDRVGTTASGSGGALGAVGNLVNVVV